MEKRSKTAEQLGITEDMARECGLQCYVEEQEFDVETLYEKYTRAAKENDLEAQKRAYAVISREAENGNGAAVNLLAVLEEAENGMKNAQKAVRLLKRAAKLDYAVAHWNLAKMYYSGKYVRRNKEKYITLLKKAVEGGCKSAIEQSAYHYENGNSELGIEKDWEKAEEFYEKLLKKLERDESDKTYRKALYKSVALRITEKRYYAGAETAEKTLEPLLRVQGTYTEQAYYLLGELYAKGKNGRKTLEMYWGAKERGREAIARLSYQQADSFDRLSFYEEMSAQGDLYAYKYLGDMYATGQGCVKNYAKALECYVHAKSGVLKDECEKKIEKMKYMEYCRQLYERALEAYRTESYELAIVKMEKLAETEKYPDAQVFLAKMMETGHLHYAKNEGKALQYYRNAAENHQREAQRKLVEVYRHGLLGASRDEEKAKYWAERLKK